MTTSTRAPTLTEVTRWFTHLDSLTPAPTAASQDAAAPKKRALAEGLRRASDRGAALGEALRRAQCLAPFSSQGARSFTRYKRRCTHCAIVTIHTYAATQPWLLPESANECPCLQVPYSQGLIRSRGYECTAVPNQADRVDTSRMTFES